MLSKFSFREFCEYQEAISSDIFRRAGQGLEKASKTVSQKAKVPAVRGELTNIAGQAMTPPTRRGPQDDEYTATEAGIDALQATLDLAGLEPSWGTVGDALNALISLARAGLDPRDRKAHLVNAGISAVSMLPFADVVKILKAKNLKKPAQYTARVAQTLGKPVQIAAQQLKQQRAAETLRNAGVHQPTQKRRLKPRQPKPSTPPPPF